ncbi:unnamed protein product [Vicia faba]|uniref:PB1-like domain-containing protein n=1 Tax=Vicia faba TaxID=3906 RepID=A0AAV1AFJ1_VICFA|nr:unnamed protein product [Vicia faba]
MDNRRNSWKRDEQVKFCVRPTKVHKIRIRLHHKGDLVHSPVKWYVGGIVTKISWKIDVGYISYIDLEALIQSEGYFNMKSIWYWNPRFRFSRGLRPLNNDADVLKLIEDICEFDLVDLYVEHGVNNPDVTDEAETINGFDVDDNVVEVNIEKDNKVDVENDKEVDDEGNSEKEDTVEAENDKEVDVEGDNDHFVEAKNDKVDVEVNIDKEGTTYADYVVSEGSSESEIDITEYSIDLDWTSVLNAETATTQKQCENSQAEFKQNGEDSDQLQTPAESICVLLLSYVLTGNYVLLLSSIL